MRKRLVCAVAFVPVFVIGLFALTFIEPSTHPLPANFPHSVRNPPPKHYNLSKMACETASDSVRSLHARGITGRGVGIGIIDQTLLTEHHEYADRLRWYDEIDLAPDDPARWHGTAVASIAAGRTVGVAPEADLYFIALGANWSGEPLFASGWTRSAWRSISSRRRLAVAIRRMLDVNRALPSDRKIRVLSLSIGSGPRFMGREETYAAIEEARRAGIFVSDIGLRPKPVGPLTIADPGGAGELSCYPSPAGSWTIAYIAGRYALAVQEDRSITPERFLHEFRSELPLR